MGQLARRGELCGWGSWLGGGAVWVGQLARRGSCVGGAAS